MNKIAIACALALGVSATVQAAGGDPKAGEAKAAVCAACHGPQGNSFNPLWPKLAGQQASYIVKQLQNFKAGKRSDPIMMGQAAGLNDEDMQNLAVYYATQTIAAGNADAAQAAIGQRLYTGGNLESGLMACAGCHGPDASGNAPAQFPGLKGQHAAYVTKQLQDFRSGTRQNDLNGMMQGVAKRMTDDEIKAVAEYISSLK